MLVVFCTFALYLFCGMNALFAVKSYLHYLLKAHRRGGYGIHSPFVFRLLSTVFYENTPYYCYRKIESMRTILLQNTQHIKVTDFGTGKYRKRRINDIARRSAKSPKYAQLLFRLANSNRSQTTLELGTCVGLTTLYLAAANRQGKVITLDGDETLCKIARSNFDQFGGANIESRDGLIDNELPSIVNNISQLDFAFFDANHTGEATQKYFELCLPKAHKNSIFVFDDIYRSKDMCAAWQKIKARENIRLAIDIYQMGIVFFNTDLIKQEYVVFF